MSITAIVVLVLVFIYILIASVNYFISIDVYGKVPKDEDALRLIMENLEGGVRPNPLDRDIISLGECRKFYFYPCSSSILLFKYHIDGVGLIPIWYKTHEILEKISKKEKEKWQQVTRTK